jgi:hypothetical protein
VGQIQPVTLVGPGHKGLNKEREYNLLPSDWATEALNMVLTRPGQITARNGWQTQTDTAITNTPNIDVLFEYVEKDGTQSPSSRLRTTKSFRGSPTTPCRGTTSPRPRRLPATTGSS